MPHFCAVVGCLNNSKKHRQKKYYQIPSERDTRGRVLQERIKRRQAWIQALHRSDLTETKIKYMRICSDHFLSGKPAVFEDTNNPDYVPHLKMGYQSFKSSPRSAARRYNRAKERDLQKLKAATSKLLENIEDSNKFQSDNTTTAVCLSSLPENVNLNGTNEACAQGIAQNYENEEKLEESEESKKLSLEVRYLNEQLYTCRNQIKALSITEATFEGNDTKTKFYTGLPTFTALIKIFDLVQGDISDVSCMSKFQQFILTLMHLRLDLMFTDLGYRFNVSVQTSSRIFYKCLNVLYEYLKHFIIWPDRDDLIATMPECFKKHFGNKVTVIIDCFEVRIEKSGNLKAQSATWSNYKHGNTIKMLVGICPQGAITFISKAYGGRNTDRMITEKCGILNNLLPGDLVLADRGFLIEDCVKMRLAEVRIPDFLRNKKQLDPIQIESTRHLARVRIHVERVIGAVRRKYRILHNLIPLSTIRKRNIDMNVPVIDQILTVTCALTNLCPSVVP